MTPHPLPMSPAYREAVRGLLRMHQFTVDGQDQSEDADVLRESMNEPWERLSAVERDRVAGLSKDLYTITDPPQLSATEPINPQAYHKFAEAQEARERGEWDRALELLRWGGYAPPPLISFLRARIWQGAGDWDVAVLFFEHATKLDPNNETFQVAYLTALKHIDNPRAIERAEQVISTSEKLVPMRMPNGHWKDPEPHID